MPCLVCFSLRKAFKWNSDLIDALGYSLDLCFLLKIWLIISVMRTLKPEKNSGLNEMWTHDLCVTSAVLSTNWAIKPTARSRGWRIQVKTVQMNGYTTNSQRGQLSVGLIAQSVEHCTAGYRRGHEFYPVQAWIFFRLEFHNCLICVHNCDDRSYLYIIFLSSKMVSNIHLYSLFSFVSQNVCFMFLSRRPSLALKYNFPA